MITNHNNGRVAVPGLTKQAGEIAKLTLVKAGLIGVFALWLVASMTQFVLLVTDHQAATDPLESPQETIAVQINSRPDVDISILLEAPLFDEVVAASVEPLQPEPEKEKPLVETQLNLTLKGLFTATEPELGQAIIANGSKENLYQADEEIKGLNNVKLLAVYEDRITLDNRGNREVLYLYAPGERLQSTASTSSNVVDNKVATPEIVITATDKQSIKKLNEIMRVVRERDKTTGNMLGFRVLPGRDREGFSRSGLKVNDVITSIDGDQLTDLKTAMTIYRNKRDATQVSLIIQRDGGEISLDIDLTELNI